MEKRGGKGGNKGGGNSRKKWSKDGGGCGGHENNDNSNHGNGGVQMMGNKWMLFCKRKTYGWNTTNTSRFHMDWAKNKKTFTLPATHEFCIKTGTAGFDSSSSTQPELSPRSGGGYLAAAKFLFGTAEGLINENRQNTKAVLEHYKENAVDSDLSTFMSDLQTAWGLN